MYKYLTTLAIKCYLFFTIIQLAPVYISINVDTSIPDQFFRPVL